MKNIKRFSATTILVLALTVSAYSGEMSAPGATSPTPQQQSSITGDIGTPGATSTGDIPCPGIDALDPVTEAALGFLQSVLALF